MDADAVVTLLLPDRLASDGRRVEDDAVGLHGLVADRTDDRLVRGDRVLRAGGEEVHVKRRAVRLAGPHLEQHGPLEHERVGVRRLAEPVQEPFDAVPHEDQLELIAAFAGEVQQPLADGGGEVGRVPLGHDVIASTYGRMTFATRQTVAAR
jgi:hypothetical protein